MIVCRRTEKIEISQPSKVRIHCCSSSGSMQTGFQKLTRTMQFLVLSTDNRFSDAGLPKTKFRGKSVMNVWVNAGVASISLFVCLWFCTGAEHEMHINQKTTQPRGAAWKKKSEKCSQLFGLLHFSIGAVATNHICMQVYPTTKLLRVQWKLIVREMCIRTWTAPVRGV